MKKLIVEKVISKTLFAKIGEEKNDIKNVRKQYLIQQEYPSITPLNK
jgi:hypothetical protein